MELTGLKHCSIDPTTASRDEIIAEINRLNHLMNEKGNEEQAIKIFINSIYGATASPYFVGYNVRVAEAITLQGQDIIKFVSKTVNRYFYEFWHRDTELHTKLGITKVEKVKNDVTIYGDTDSAYVTFQEPLFGSDWSGEDPTEFVLGVYNHRLKDYLKKAFDKYGDSWGTQNIQDLEMETISYSAIFLRKKKYVLDLRWKDPGVFYEPQKKIKAKGVEIAQGSTPSFVRARMKTLLEYIFREKNKLNLREFAEILKKEKQAFTVENIENVAFSSSISDYEKGIADDRKKFEINSHCPIHVRAAGYHNFMLNNSKWKNKYQLIKSGDKVRYYYAKAERGEENVFAFLPGNFPVELAPPVDYDTQFSKGLIEPLNRFISAIGLPPISPEIIVRTQLF
jgi:DNA polymerase elongation subunit (family B)